MRKHIAMLTPLIPFSLANLTVSSTLGRDGSPALLIQAGSGNSLTIDGGLNGAINQFTFTDGSSLSLNQLMGLANTASATIAGANGNVIFGAHGYDSLVGGAGNGRKFVEDKFAANDAVFETRRMA